MRRSVPVAIIVLLTVSLSLWAEVNEALTKADDLHDKGACSEARALVLSALGGASAKEKAELYWRAARETLDLGDDAEDAKQPQAAILKFFEEGEAYAKKAIESDPQNNLGYYWQSANIGRWGQVKGILDSLFKAGPMKDLLFKDIGLDAEHADAYNVLGQLYRELPGWPLSFGNVDYAVSLGRKAMDLNAAQVASGKEKKVFYGYHIQLAKTLKNRNRNAGDRTREQKNQASRYAAAKDVLERNCNYESQVTLQTLSDKEEGKLLLQQAIAALEKIADKTEGEKGDLDEARETLKSY